MARAAATEVTDRWKGFTRTLGLQYLNGDFEIANEQHSTSLLYAEGVLTRKKADNLYFPLSGYNLLYGLRVAAESVASDTSFVQARAEAKWLKKVRDRDRVILRAMLGGMYVDNFDALPPELRFFAGGDRSIRGFDYQQIGDLDAKGEVIGGEYQAIASAEYEHYFLQNWGVAATVASRPLVGSLNTISIVASYPDWVRADFLITAALNPPICAALAVLCRTIAVNPPNVWNRCVSRVDSVSH